MPFPHGFTAGDTLFYFRTVNIEMKKNKKNYNAVGSYRGLGKKEADPIQNRPEP
jgi:hypothetical protein